VILACPTCDSRYDVTGYPIGQQFRCRCGTVTTLQAPASEAGMLSCPHCGAPVAENASRCEHCQVGLLAKACPRCLARVFAGHAHCPQCGAELDVAAVGETRTDLMCPRCDIALHARLVGDVVIDECDRCLGLFLDHIAIQRVITDRAQARAEALLGALPRQETKTRPGERMYVKCPACRTLMNRRLFATGAGVIVDVCRTHGTFFDAGELPAIIDFVMKGGLEQAARKDLEREQHRIDLERESQRGIQRALGASSGLTTYASASSAFIDLLGALLDR
jgi:Zn-finger nucleic acid-binding protein